jgi:hypothetical protein
LESCHLARNTHLIKVIAWLIVDANDQQKQQAIFDGAFADVFDEVFDDPFPGQSALYLSKPKTLPMI